MTETIPIILFAYARPQHLERTLESLRANEAPLIYAFSDGPKTVQAASQVSEVRAILRAIDWCDVVLTERDENRGLCRSILSGVTEVLAKYEAALIFEDDITCVPGSYAYLTAALRHYAGNPAVMSVTGWTHPRVTPSNVSDQPYFDGRAECWLWGTWARAWTGMERNATTLKAECLQRGLDVFRYGADLPRMARLEQKRSIWAVRWAYVHLLRGGLCLRPPRSLVENIGFGQAATNTAQNWEWPSFPPNPCPPIPDVWPEPVENPECPGLWQAVYGRSPMSYYAKRARSLVLSKLGFS
jgi:hypothetical protein